ncbi:tyramine--L-glutamate ligase [Methanococcus sp. CF]
MSDKKIFLFEFTVGTGLVPDELLAEGKLMFDILLNQFLNENYTVKTILCEKIAKKYPEYNKMDNLEVIVSDDYINSFISCLKDSDFALAIAPEEDMILYNLTELIEESGCLNLGCNKLGVKIAGDKFLTYEAIKNFVNTPKTYPIKKYVVKNRLGCDSTHDTFDENYIVQEFIEGEPYSIIFIVKNKKFYSLCMNKQYIEERYCGGEINIDHPLKEKAIIECKKTLEQIDGINGYVGVDFMIDGENISILEVNPRITTSICGIKSKPSVGKLLIDNAFGKEIKFEAESGLKFKRKDFGFEFL